MHLAKIMYHRYKDSLNDFLGTAKHSKVKGVSWKTIQKKLTAKQKMLDRKEWLEAKESQTQAESNQMKLEFKD